MTDDVPHLHNQGSKTMTFDEWYSKNVSLLTLRDGLLDTYVRVIAKKAWDTARPSPVESPAPLTCAWHEEDVDCDLWGTGCGKEFAITAGAPAENDMNYCCFCSGKILVEPSPQDTEGGVGK